MPESSNGGPSRAGRKRVTSRAELEHVAFGLFAEHGFERTTIDELADAAGIGRRTFFRYFPSKNDVVWGDFNGQLELMRSHFRACPANTPLMAAIRDVVIAFNLVAPEEKPWHRRRLELILTVPALQAHSTLRYADWRAVVAEFAADRLGTRQSALLPQAIAHATLGVAVAAYERWLADQASTLETLLADALQALADGFAT